MLDRLLLARESLVTNAALNGHFVNVGEFLLRLQRLRDRERALESNFISRLEHADVGLRRRLIEHVTHDHVVMDSSVE